MVLLLIILGIVMMGGGLFLIRHISENGKWWIGLVIAICYLPIFAVLMGIAAPSQENYPLRTSVLLTGDAQRTQIFFSEFTQDGNKVTIKEYATLKRPWTDFDYADESIQPINITLSDNEGNFIYTDRRTGKTFNENIGAIQ